MLKKIIHRIEIVILFLLLVSCVVFPFSFYIIKLPILGYFLIKSLLKILLLGKMDMSPTVFVLFFINVATGLFFIIYGKVTGNAHPESLPYMIFLYVVFPITFGLLISLISKSILTLERARTYFFFTLFCVSTVMIIAFFLKKMEMHKLLQYFSINVDIRTAVVRIRYNGISSFLFLFPMFFTLFVLNRKQISNKKYILHILALILAIIAVFLSGRRALFILFIFAVIFAFASKRLIERGIRIKKKTLQIMMLIFVLMLPVIIISFPKISKTAGAAISYAFKIGEKNNFVEYNRKLGRTNIKENERSEQLNHFISHIAKSPALGYGHGAYMDDIVRSKDKPWRYELSYVALIYHTGFIGFLLYCVGPLWIIVSLQKIARYNVAHREMAIALLNGFICVLIAFITNPYLNAFDIQWTIYFPLLFIIIVNREERKKLAKKASYES